VIGVIIFLTCLCALLGTALVFAVMATRRAGIAAMDNLTHEINKIKLEGVKKSEEKHALSLVQIAKIPVQTDAELEAELNK
jgi:hypothetical protein